MNKKKIYIIGSMSVADTIKHTAMTLSNNDLFSNFDIDYVKPVANKNEEISQKTIIELNKKCMKNILNSDIVIAIPKKDCTFGDSTMYEISYANRLGIPVLLWNLDFVTVDNLKSEDIKKIKVIGALEDLDSMTSMIKHLEKEYKCDKGDILILSNFENLDGPYHMEDLFTDAFAVVAFIDNFDHCNKNISRCVQLIRKMGIPVIMVSTAYQGVVGSELGKYVNRQLSMIEACEKGMEII